MSLYSGLRDVESYMTFLSKDALYQNEKPYTTDFLVDGIEGAKITNHKYDTQPVTFYDARVVKDSFALDRNGFCYIEAKTSLLDQDATPERTQLMEQYMQEITKIVGNKFPQYQEIRCMDFQVRRRHPAFSDGEKRSAEFAQPSIMAHTDFSQRGSFLRMADIFSDQEVSYKNKKFDLLNHIIPEDQVVTNDALHYKRVGENSLLHHSNAQRWYYLSDMEEDDLIVFRNTDSEGTMPRGFHASFYNPTAAGELRHSIEVRLVAFRD